MSITTDATRAIAHRIASLGPYPGERFCGRGVVVCAGGTQMFVNAYVLLRILREILHCKLPIQLWHIGPGELSPLMRRVLQDLDVELVDLDSVRLSYPTTIVDGWQLKPYAILHSRFKEVLLLDADQVPVRDPADVFQWPQYLQMGAVFWPDKVDLASDNPIWSICGLEPRRCTSFDSGQLLIDKERHWTALHLTLWLNEHAEIFYRLIYGDKDTFLIGWLLAQKSYAFVPHRPYLDCGCLTQRDFDGAPLFQHRTNAKWSYAEPQVKITNFIHEQACQGFLSELRQVWNGRLFYPPERSLSARAMEARLIGRWMHLVLFGETDFEIEFLRGHQFGVGRSSLLQNWHVRGSENALELVLRDTHRDTYRFVLQHDGTWSGCRLVAPHCEARLVGHTNEMTPSDRWDLIGDLVAASGLATIWSQQAEDDLLAALRLISRINPETPDHLRACCAGHTAQNPGLSECLGKIATRLTVELATERSSVSRSHPELLRRYYIPTGFVR